MPHTFDVRLAGLHWQFSRSPAGLWQIWPWKLDPFRMHGAAEKPCVCVDLCPCGTPADMPETFPPLLRKASGFFTNTVHSLPDGDVLWQMSRTSTEQPVLRMRTDAGWRRVSLLLDETASAGAAAFEYLSQITPGLFLQRGRITFHAALVEYRGSAFAVCADSGTGKTTHARLWRDCAGALILNGDRAVCAPTETGWTAFGTPWSGTSGEQLARCAPLRAFVVLERAGENTACRLEPSEASAALLPHLLYPSWDRALTERALALIDDLLRRLPAYRLRCRPDEQAVAVLRRALWEDEDAD